MKDLGRVTSSDLTFVTNEAGQCLLDRFRGILGTLGLLKKPDDVTLNEVKGLQVAQHQRLRDSSEDLRMTTGRFLNSPTLPIFR